uniref:DNA repair protein RAD51 homolog 2-like n=2 Tax=Hirondellea gigas TaxID=1518452 RepID=A0A6A7G305_9CRUS
MAKRRLVSLDLDDDLQRQLSRHSLKTVQDVLQLSLLDQMRLLCLSADQARDLQLRLCSICAPKHNTVWSLLQQQRQGCSSLSMGHSGLDSLLAGGLQLSAITELAGPAGVGKTQWCVEMAVRCLLTEPSKSVIYIDTEAAFMPSRVVEVLSERLPPDEQHRVPELLSRIMVHQPSTVSSLHKIVRELEMQAAECGAGLVVVDSIASLARKEFPPHQPGQQGGAWRRVLLMAGWAASLKTLAANRNLVVLVSNQVSSRTVACEVAPEEEDEAALAPAGVREECEGGGGDGEEESSRSSLVQYRQYVTPALGNTWSHFINTRLILQYTDHSPIRQLLIAKSPVSPFATFNYTIEASGVKVQGGGSYSYSGSDPGLHMIHVEQGPIVS